MTNTNKRQRKFNYRNREYLINYTMVDGYKDGFKVTTQKEVEAFVRSAFDSKEYDMNSISIYGVTHGFYYDYKEFLTKKQLKNK